MSDGTQLRRPTGQATRGVEIPGVLLGFLDRATVAVCATRDGQLVPRIRYVCGWRVEPGNRILRCAIQDRGLVGLEESLRDNREFAVAIEEIGPHETYQFKGEVVELVPCDEQDRAVADAARAKFTRSLSSYYSLPDSTSRAYFGEPGRTARVAVREIFVQTPGPGAGVRLVPPPEVLP